MKTNTKLFIAAASRVVATSAVAQEAEKPVRVKTDGMPEYLKVRIEAAAQQGPTALRRYLDSTRHIHNIRMESIVKEEPRTTMVKQGEPAKLADRSEAKK